MEDWRPYIEEQVTGAPRAVRIRGTEVEVEVVLELLADGSTVESVCEQFPNLTSEGVRACIAYGKEAVERQAFRRDLDWRIARLKEGHIIPNDEVWNELEKGLGPLPPLRPEEDES